ncbi:MAG: hypothetical protein PHH11_03800 [Methylomonas sp.]|nr:hypothetical protein [Methylomonas sp.]
MAETRDTGPGMLLNLLIGALTIGYPFLVWFTLDYFQPGVLALMLAGVFLLRFALMGRNAPASAMTGYGVAACVLFLLAISWINRVDGLLLYPVFVSLLFFVIFASSLLYPPPVIERLARLEDPELPPKGVAYTRKVTQAWSLFFLANAAVSLITVCYGDRWLWSLYNGFVFYLLMGLLMAVEMAVRRKVKASY